MTPFFITRLEELENLDTSRFLGADLIEWRADFLEPSLIPEVAGRIKVLFNHFDLLFTYRTERSVPVDISSKKYRGILQNLAAAEPEYLDLEVFSYPGVIQDFQDYEGRLLLSSHDFKGMPADLSIRMARMIGLCRSTKDLVKLAFFPRTGEEFERLDSSLANLKSQYGGQVILIGMGKLGQGSRVHVNNPWTFAAANGYETAPGQLSLDQALALFKA